MTVKKLIELPLGFKKLIKFIMFSHTHLLVEEEEKMKPQKKQDMKRK
jgi:hypothetical protein